MFFYWFCWFIVYIESSLSSIVWIDGDSIFIVIKSLFLRYIFGSVLCFFIGFFGSLFRVIIVYLVLSGLMVTVFLLMMSTVTLFFLLPTYLHYISVHQFRFISSFTDILWKSIKISFLSICILCLCFLLYGEISNLLSFDLLLRRVWNICLWIFWWIGFIIPIFSIWAFALSRTLFCWFRISFRLILFTHF